ncbi:MAG: hypothetical protein K6B17_09220 [Treponema sp.]|nr:hypothetical protein [Treponema sp.]
MQKFTKILSALFLASVFTSAVFAKDPLPSGYKNIKFGMTLDEVKKALKKDLNFGYRGDRDVSLLPGGENRVLIETDTSKNAPYSFLEKCWFQFHDNKLYTITITMRRSKIDHYSIYTKLVEKYGEPSTLSPEKTEWIDDNTIISLERPLTLKYTDKKVFEKMQSDAMVKKSAEEQAKQDFLDQL